MVNSSITLLRPARHLNFKTGRETTDLCKGGYRRGLRSYSIKYIAPDRMDDSAAGIFFERFLAISALWDRCATMLFCFVTAEVAGSSPVIPAGLKNRFVMSEGRNSNRAGPSVRSPRQAIS
jgi:hypothetical protein